MHNNSISPSSDPNSGVPQVSADDLADVRQQQANMPRRHMSVMRKTAYPWLSLSVLVIILDQLSKAWVSNNLDYAEIQKVLPFLNLTLVYNPGAAFSFLADAGGWQRWFFAGIAGTISLILFVWITRTPRDGHHLQAAALSSILGGALGNLWDRLEYGHVIDFIDFYIRSWHWPAFNIADTAIAIGAALLLLQIILEKEPEN